jgi:DNA-directed RNA polymerase subunit RPC12/RpoP
MDLNRISVEYNKIKNLRQYKNFSEEDLRRIAYSRAVEYQIDVDSLFVNEEDKNAAKALVRKYLDDYTPETISDINTLRSILFLEVLNGRLQDELNKAKEAQSDMNLRTVETIHKNLNQILVLKDSLGLTKDKKEGNAKSVDQKIRLMRKQFQVWMENNQASRDAVCPYCGQHFLLRIRMEHWEAQKHPFFKDRILYNKPLVDLCLNNIITKDKLAEILDCSPDYIDWVIDKVHKQKGEEPEKTIEK